MSADIFHSHVQQAVFRRYLYDPRYGLQRKGILEASRGFRGIAKSHVAYVKTQDVSLCGSAQCISRGNADDGRVGR